MKWPEYLVLVRHAKSIFNELKERLEKDPLWLIFVEAYKDVKTYQEERMVERSVGIRQLYTHWRIFH